MTTKRAAYEEREDEPTAPGAQLIDEDGELVVASGTTPIDDGTVYALIDATRERLPEF